MNVPTDWIVSKLVAVIFAAGGQGSFALTCLRPAGSCQLIVHFVVETREKFQFEMNGWRLSFRDEGYWVDVSFRKMMVGEFAVEQRKNEFVLSERPQVLREDNWVEQGYPFFCGSIIEQD